MEVKLFKYVDISNEKHYFWSDFWLQIKLKHMQAVWFLTRKVTGSMTFYRGCNPYTSIHLKKINTKKKYMRESLCHTQILQVKHIWASHLLTPIHIPFTSVFPFWSARALSCLERLVKTRTNSIRAQAIKLHFIGWHYWMNTPPQWTSRVLSCFISERDS